MCYTVPDPEALAELARLEGDAVIKSEKESFRMPKSGLNALHSVKSNVTFKKVGSSLNLASKKTTEVLSSKGSFMKLYKSKNSDPKTPGSKSLSLKESFSKLSKSKNSDSKTPGSKGSFSRLSKSKNSDSKTPGSKGTFSRLSKSKNSDSKVSDSKGSVKSKKEGEKSSNLELEESVSNIKSK